MKDTTKLPRRQARENAFKAAFALTFQEQTPDEALQHLEEGGELPLDTYGRALLTALREHREEIDAVIQRHLKGWTLDRISRPSVVALRIALAELLYGEENKPAVAINEAVELAKRYGGESDYQFVNGLLGSVVRQGDLPAAPAPAAQDAPC